MVRYCKGYLKSREHETIFYKRKVRLQACLSLLLWSREKKSSCHLRGRLCHTLSILLYSLLRFSLTFSSTITVLHVSFFYHFCPFYSPPYFMVSFDLWLLQPHGFCLLISLYVVLIFCFSLGSVLVSHI